VKCGVKLTRWLGRLEMNCEVGCRHSGCKMEEEGENRRGRTIDLYYVFYQDFEKNAHRRLQSSLCRHFRCAGIA
jgi:hypothetical protein